MTSEKTILVCGGAGYIGSHMVKLLDSAGYEVVVFDNLSSGHREALKWGAFVEGDLLNIDQLQDLFRSYSFDAVMHFSAKSLVGESVRNPFEYYQNNVVGTLNLLQAMQQQNVEKFIFSSSAAIFGHPQSDLINEQHPKEPINPYGRTKLMVEQMLKDTYDAHGISSVSLRYFNAAGSDASGQIGESHTPETHLIPNVLKAALGEGVGLKLFGDDYKTPDGTCIRDYVHVNDLASAHIKALNYLNDHSGALAFNLGNGQGFSVREVLNACEIVTGNKIDHEVVDRRPGDPGRLVANSAQAQRELDWRPEYSSIESIIKTAWTWHQNPKY